MLSDGDLTLRTLIVCEDVRTEDNGKQMIIGVYTGHVQPDSFPAHLLFSLWLEFEARTSGKKSVSIRVGVSGVDGHFELNADIDVESTEHALSLGTPRFGVNILGEGDLVVEAKLHDGEWQEVRRKKIIQRPS